MERFFEVELIKIFVISFSFTLVIFVTILFRIKSFNLFNEWFYDYALNLFRYLLGPLVFGLMLVYLNSKIGIWQRDLKSKGLDVYSFLIGFVLNTFLIIFVLFAAVSFVSTDIWKTITMLPIINFVVRYFMTLPYIYWINYLFKGFYPEVKRVFKKTYRQ